MDDLITEEPPSFWSKIKRKTLLAFSYHNTSTTKTLSPFSPSLDFQKYSKRLFGIHCLYLALAFILSLAKTYNNLY